MAAGDTKTLRIRPYYGGIVVGERDRRPGVCQNVEEFDIYSNPDYMEPETIFSADATIANGAWDFTHDGTNVFAISTDGGGTPVPRIWKRASGMTSGLAATSWGAGGYFDDTGQTVNYDSFLECLEWEAGTRHLYYVTGTNTLRKYGDIDGTPAVSTVGTLTGAASANGRLPTLIREGELLIGHGKYICRVDDNGNFDADAWTCPTGWKIVDMEIVSDNVAVLCSPSSLNSGQSAIFYWDGTATTGFVDFVYIPTGDPQMLVNHAESLRVFCVSKTSTTTGALRIYEMLGKKPFLTHQLDNIDCDYNTPTGAFNYAVSPRTKFLSNNILYFGVAKTDTTGIYAIGQAQDDKPLALSLSRRCHTTDYANHYPLALFGVNKDLLLSMWDANTTAQYRHQIMIYATATRSSNAVYESIILDDSDPETPKRWDRFYAVTGPLASGVSIAVSGRVDNASSYTQAQTFDVDNNTFHTAPVNFNGKAFQLKVAATSSTTSKVKIYSLGVRIVEESLKQASSA